MIWTCRLDTRLILNCIVYQAEFSVGHNAIINKSLKHNLNYKPNYFSLLSYTQSTCLGTCFVYRWEQLMSKTEFELCSTFEQLYQLLLMIKTTFELI